MAEVGCVSLCVRKKDVVCTDMAWALQEFEGKSLVVYVRTKFMAERMAELMGSRRSAMSLTPAEAECVAKRFAAGEVDLVYTIVPFAPEVPRDAVLHYVLPKSLASYREEIGRCGRAVLFFNDRDRYEVRRVLKRFRDADQEREWACVEEYMATKNCREQLLKAYAGVETDHACARCDNCTGDSAREQTLVATFHDTYKNLPIPQMVVAVQQFVAQYDNLLPFEALENKCVGSREVITYVAEKKRRDVFIDLVHILVKKGYAHIVFRGCPLQKKILFTKRWTHDFQQQTALMQD